MNELHRQAYLDAMGVDVYFPRILLPGAPESRLCEIPRLPDVSEPKAFSSDNSQTESVGSSTIGSQGRAATMQALLAEGFEGTLRSVRDSRQATTSKVELQRQPAAPRFILSVTRVGDIVIIDDASEEGSVEFQRLQQNFLSAMGLVTDRVVSNFKWPIVENGHLDQSQSAAKQTLRLFVHNQLETTPPVALLLMGETACSYLLDNKPIMGEWLAESFANAQVLCAPSLTAALGSGQSKQLIWQAIRPLRKKLVP